MSQLTAHQFSSGDIVGVVDAVAASSILPTDTTTLSASTPTGVVVRATTTAITVAFDSEVSHMHEPLRLRKLANEVTYRRMGAVLSAGLGDETGPGATARPHPLRRGGGPQRAAKRGAALWHQLDFTPFNAQLNESQVDAIRFALCAKDIALIRGPPGRREDDDRRRVCAAGSASRRPRARLRAEQRRGRQPRVAARRQGGGIERPAASRPPRRDCCRRCCATRSRRAFTTCGAELVKDVQKEIADVQRRATPVKTKPAERRALYLELRGLREGGAGARGDRRARGAPTASNVVCCTTIGAASRDLRAEAFDLVVIDEAAQALEPACWIAMLKAPRCVLAGDHKQLAPTVKSSEATKAGLGVTLFDRVACALRRARDAHADAQYRMNELISRWASDATYDGRLASWSGVSARTLNDVPRDAADAAEAAVSALIEARRSAGRARRPKSRRWPMSSTWRCVRRTRCCSSTRPAATCRRRRRRRTASEAVARRATDGAPRSPRSRSPSPTGVRRASWPRTSARCCPARSRRATSA